MEWRKCCPWPPHQIWRQSIKKQRKERSKTSKMVLNRGRLLFWFFFGRLLLELFSFKIVASTSSFLQTMRLLEPNYTIKKKFKNVYQKKSTKRTKMKSTVILLKLCMKVGRIFRNTQKKFQGNPYTDFVYKRTNVYTQNFSKYQKKWKVYRSSSNFFTFRGDLRA